MKCTFQNSDFQSWFEEESVDQAYSGSCWIPWEWTNEGEVDKGGCQPKDSESPGNRQIRESL